MMKRVSLLAGMLIAAVAANQATAQTTTDLGAGRGGSGHVRTAWAVGGAHISIEYGRPALKGRAEAQMMPVGKPWRTGADAATVLTTDKALTFGSVTLKPGSYTINTQPGEASWTFIFGKLDKAGQWGVPYLQNLEIGRAPATLTRLKSPVELVTFSIDKSGNGQALALEWGTVHASTPFTIAK